MTPAERYALGPLDGPGHGPTPWPVTIRTATVSTSGCISIDKHLLGVGRRFAHTQATTIRRHRQVAVFAGNQLIAEFTLNGAPWLPGQEPHTVTEVLRHMCH